MRFRMLFGLLLLPLLVLAKDNIYEWEKIFEGHEMVVFRKEVPGHDTFAFRAVGKIPAPIAKVASVLIDIDRRVEWMPDLGETHLIEQLNENERVEYVHLKTPFVIKDREFILHAKADWDKKNRVVTFSFDSTSNSLVPDTKRVRAELFESRYTLKDLGDATEVEFVVHVDPKGSVPKWLVNLFQKDYPRKTLDALKEQSLKSDVIESAAVLNALSGLSQSPQEE